MKRRLTHHVEWVRDAMSAVSAIVAAYVPTPEPSVARKSGGNMPLPRASWRDGAGCGRA